MNPKDTVSQEVRILMPRLTHLSLHAHAPTCHKFAIHPPTSAASRGRYPPAIYSCLSMASRMGSIGEDVDGRAISPMGSIGDNVNGC